MAIPASYTEKQLADYMHRMLGKTGEVLSFRIDPDGPGDYAEAVNEALLAYGAGDISTITGAENIQKLRAYAQIAAWQHAVNNFAALYDVSSDGANLRRSQLFDHAQKALAAAVSHVSVTYGTVYAVKVIKLTRIEDPYIYTVPEENAE